MTFFASLLDLHRWEYMHSPSENSKEAEILEVLRHPRDWVHWYRQSSLPGIWGPRTCAPFHWLAPLPLCGSSYLCLRAPVFSTLKSASLASGEMCFKHHRFPLDVGDRWWDGSCQSQLVDIKLIYTFRIILYDWFINYDIEFPSIGNFSCYFHIMFFFLKF